jgi:hypothetical protein
VTEKLNQSIAGIKDAFERLRNDCFLMAIGGGGSHVATRWKRILWGFAVEMCRTTPHYGVLKAV